MAQVMRSDAPVPSHLTPVAYPKKARDRFLLARFVTGELVPIIAMCIVIFAGMIWMVSAAILTKYIASGVPAWALIEVMALNLPSPIVIALPMAMLLGAILGFQKLSTDSEAVALLAAGVSFWRLLAIALVIGAVISCIGLGINNSLVPYANDKLNDLKSHVLDDPSSSSAAAHPFDLPPMRDHDQHLLATVHVEGGYDTVARALRQVTINEFDPKSGRIVATITADKARWKGNQTWELRDAETITRNGLVFSSASIDTKDISAQPNTVAFLNQSPDSLTFSQLARQIAQLRSAGAGKLDVVRTAEVSLWNKISLPLAGLVMALVGALLGFRPQRAASKGTAVALGLVIVFSYYFLTKLMEVVSAGGSWDPFTAAFLPDAAGMLVALVLMYRVTT